MMQMTPLTLSGTLRLQDAPGLIERLAAALAAGDVEIDASGVLAVDAAAVQVLVSAARTAGATGRRLVLAQDHPALTDALAGLALDPVPEGLA
ncbi:STAS domain-containing protein [Cereibacter sphaeroides]|uniref:STAS domain-containing protein n=1 Tax=Cereibacter sphaeroides TaxID=1063 RepID=A0AAX1UFX6_CERSP|nr:STAS domain-containing protein [Cereibacter sphaeroides]RHZ91343.1 STAS domain-containing protein [Cereibacter sphaeroides]